jgi:hypothetical protein
MCVDGVHADILMLVSPRSTACRPTQSRMSCNNVYQRSSRYYFKAPCIVGGLVIDISLRDEAGTLSALRS